MANLQLIRGEGLKVVHSRQNCSDCKWLAKTYGIISGCRAYKASARKKPELKLVWDRDVEEKLGDVGAYAQHILALAEPELPRP